MSPDLLTLTRVSARAQPFSSMSPNQFKGLMAKKHASFQGDQQQDAEEFLRFMLASLHESLNRAAVVNAANGALPLPVNSPTGVNRSPSPQVAAAAASTAAVVPVAASRAVVSSDGAAEVTPEVKEADQHWRTFLLKNRSVITDLFYFQVVSTLRCCGIPPVAVPITPVGPQASIGDAGAIAGAAAAGGIGSASASAPAPAAAGQSGQPASADDSKSEPVQPQQQQQQLVREEDLCNWSSRSFDCYSTLPLDLVPTVKPEGPKLTFRVCLTRLQPAAVSAAALDGVTKPCHPEDYTEAIIRLVVSSDI